MKIARFALPVLALVTSLATSAHAQRKDTLFADPDPNVAMLQGFVDDAIEAAGAALASGDSPEKSIGRLGELVQIESQLVVYTEAECAVLRRLTHEIADMRVRASAYVAREIDLFQLRQEILLARLERAMARQSATWASGSVDATTADAAVAVLASDVFPYLTTPHFGDVRQRLAEAIEHATLVASNEIARMQAAHHFYDVLYGARWDAAHATWSENALDGLATWRDLERLSDASVDLFTLIQSPTPYTCVP